MLPKLDSLFVVQDFVEGLGMDVAEGTLEETWPHRSVGIDDGGNPRGIAARRLRWELPELGSEVEGEATEFFRAFSDKAGGEVSGVLADERFDLPIQLFNFQHI